MAEFVNPYTFVPLPERVSRSEPPGHASVGADRYVGTLAVTVTALTPLLVDGFREGDETGSGPQGPPVIAGSSLHGVVRSVHEALTGSCLRITNLDLVPVHRQQANPDELRTLTMAVVTSVDGDGLPIAVRLCSQVVHVRADSLAGRGLRTGAVLEISSSSVQRNYGKDQAADGVAATGRSFLDHPELALGPQEHVLLLTDTAARPTKRSDGSSADAWFAASRPDGKVVPVTSAARSDLVLALSDADDRRPAQIRARGVDREFIEVTWCGQVVGERLVVTGRLRPGQPVWVRLGAGSEVEQVRLSQIWRHPGGFSVRDRIEDAGAAGCDDPAELCPSCRVFGSAADDGRDRTAEAAQLSYRGHVRFEDAVARGEEPPDGWRDTWELAPTAAPKPSAGQFYLQPTGMTVAGVNRAPLSDWGSEADRPKRSIRGRKTYWRTSDPDAGPYPRGKRREHHAPEQTSAVHRVRPGVTFTTRVAVDGLSAAEIGGLLIALDPRLWAAHGGAAGVGTDLRTQLVTAVGRGKAFGFGSIRVDVTGLDLGTARSRYLGEGAPTPSAAELVGSFLTAVGRGDPAIASPGVTDRVWPSLVATLTMDRVPSALVWYPPGAGTRGDKQYDEAFTFFEATKGKQVRTRREPIVQLPLADADDQRMRTPR